MNLPREFLMRMEALLGDEFPAFLHSYEEPRCYGLRVNTLKISVEEFQRIAPFHLTPIPWVDNGFFYEKEDAPSRHPFYYAGLYYLQEPSAMTPAHILPVSPGERVLDLCAAPGGKATALAAKLDGQGMLVANDVSTSRAKALLKNLELFGVTNSFVTNEMPAKLAGQYPEFFDKILVDAPCSGEGMFRKDVANARAWSPAKVTDCAKTQKEIALWAVSMLRPGGMMLYSTCTFSPEEDEQVIAYILENAPGMELLPIPLAEGFENGRPDLLCEDWMSGKYGGEESAGRYENLHQERMREQADQENRADLTRCVRIFPHKLPGEGHFMALLKKQECPGEGRGEYKEEENNSVKQIWPDTVTRREKKKPGNCKKNRQRTAAAPGGFADVYERDITADFLREQKQTEIAEKMEIRGNRAYYVPESLEFSGGTAGIRFLRNGLYLGEIKKDRFEPSQAFAMALRPEDGEGILDFDWMDERVTRYLRGETLEVGDLPTGTGNGWRLVCVNGFPLGWGRLTGSALKNKYHPGWRIQ